MTDQGSFLNRISIRRNQVVSVESNNHDQELEDLEFFQKHVADRFSELLPKTGGAGDGDAADSPACDHAPLLSISWFRKLLDAFLLCEAEFKAVVLIGRDPLQFSKPPFDRLIPILELNAGDVFLPDSQFGEGEFTFWGGRRDL